VCTYLHACLHIYIEASFVYICTYICIYIFVYISMYTDMYTDICAYVYTYLLLAGAQLAMRAKTIKHAAVVNRVNPTRDGASSCP